MVNLAVEKSAQDHRQSIDFIDPYLILSDLILHKQRTEAVNLMINHRFAVYSMLLLRSDNEIGFRV